MHNSCLLVSRIIQYFIFVFYFLSPLLSILFLSQNMLFKIISFPLFLKFP